MDTQLDAELRANILVEALPYIQEYYGQTVVVKYGGNAMINEELKDALFRDGNGRIEQEQRFLY